MKYAIYILLGIAVFAGVASTVLSRLAYAPSSETATTTTPGDEVVACTMDAMMCPDGSYVGRTGPNCEFVCPPSPEVPVDVQAHITEKSSFIRLATPLPNSFVSSPMTITGEARGMWFFEASFPVSLVNWDGLIIAEGIATAEGEWMTEEFVPFSATLEFVNPYIAESPTFMERGSLILKKDNPSGLPEHDNALEIPVRFAR